MGRDGKIGKFLKAILEELGKEKVHDQNISYGKDTYYRKLWQHELKQVLCMYCASPFSIYMKTEN